MASIIDALIFNDQNPAKRELSKEDSTWKDLEELSKNFIISQGAIHQSSSYTSYETLNKLRLNNHDYCIRLKISD
jgi:hypothetical protein